MSGVQSAVNYSLVLALRLASSRCLHKNLAVVRFALDGLRLVVELSGNLVWRHAVARLVGVVVLALIRMIHVVTHSLAGCNHSRLLGSVRVVYR